MEIASKVFSLGNSNAIRVPRLIMEALSLHADDPITIEVVNQNELLIKKQRKQEAYPSIKELFAGYDGNATAFEMDADDSVGREIL